MKAKGCSANTGRVRKRELHTWEHDIGKGGERASLAAESFPKVISWGGCGIGAESTGVVGIALEVSDGNAGQI
jgi:hypothetical protein